MHSAACAGATSLAHEWADHRGEWIDLGGEWTDLGGESAEQLLQLVAVTAAGALLAVSNVLVHGSHQHAQDLHGRGKSRDDSDMQRRHF